MLLVSVVLAVVRRGCGVGRCAGAANMRGRRFAFGLPVLPVVLTLAVLADVYI